MAGRYERVSIPSRGSATDGLCLLTDGDDIQVNSHDEDDGAQSIPNSPPPSFHSRASSILSRENRVDPDLADAFDADGDDSDDEPDDRQRLVRGTHTPPSSNASQTAAPASRPAVPARQVTQLPPASAAATPMRIYGGGIQSDGVFSNLTAKPETGEEKEEQPPVRARIHGALNPASCY
jgi:hypothetical protein